MVMINGRGIRVDLPRGWDGEITGDLTLQADGSQRPTLGHFASFPLPPLRGDYGSGAVETMTSGDAMVMLYEYGAFTGAETLFATEGVPRALEPRDFDPNNLQRTLAGHSGVQRFFHVGDRSFCLYVVVGSHIDRADVLPAINALLASVEIAA